MLYHSVYGFEKNLNVKLKRKEKKLVEYKVVNSVL